MDIKDIERQFKRLQKKAAKEKRTADENAICQSLSVLNKFSSKIKEDTQPKKRSSSKRRRK